MIIVRWYATHKTITFMPEYIISMRIKSFWMHILLIYFKRLKFSQVGQIIRQKITNYSGEKSITKT